MHFLTVSIIIIFCTGENDLEAKYRRSILDIAVLQDHLGARADCYIKNSMNVVVVLSRQYMTMQAELTSKVKRLEEEVSRLREQLGLCQEELRTEKRQREVVEREKDATIADLRHKLDGMETDCERILHDTLDSLTSQLSVARQGWEDKSTDIHQKYKDLLSGFGLNALDI
uniref:Dynein regulatory complex protein 12 n=1 Tax=Myripristis murdjan TaxID=586833 RepID=A0A667XZ44_9TELE